MQLDGVFFCPICDKIVIDAKSKAPIYILKGLEKYKWIKIRAIVKVEFRFSKAFLTSNPHSNLSLNVSYVS